MTRYKIEHGFKHKKLIKPNPWYQADKFLLAELEAAIGSETVVQRYKEISKIISRHKPHLERTSNEFVRDCRRIVRQFDKKHRRT